MNSNLSTFTLLYASQTGQAQAIAEEVRDTAPTHGLNVDFYCLSKADKLFSLEEEKLVVFIVSTSGEGEPPDTALKFWRRISKRTLPKDTFAQLRFCLLALGDSNYSTFCNFGNQLDKRLQALGAKHFLDISCADDAVGLEIVVEPWIDSLWPALKEETNSVHSIATSRADVLIHLLHSESKLLRMHQSANDDGKTNENKLSIQTKADSPGASEVTQLIKTLDLNSSSAPEVDSTTTKGAKNEQVHSLTSSVAPLCNSALILPALTPAFLKVTLTPQAQDEERFDHSHSIKTAPNGQPITYVSIKRALRLTTSDAVKTVLEVSLDLTDTDFQYNPGDYVYVLGANDAEEIDLLIHRLGLESQANDCLLLEVTRSSKKTETKYFSQLPSELTLRDYLLHFCDVRIIPKKVFLRCLSEYTEFPAEKRRLQELSSRQGADDYGQFIRNEGLSLLELLSSFPSCHPPLEQLLEHLPKLQPRPYSIASSQKVDHSILKFAFTLVELPSVVGLHERRGICTGWLNKITTEIQETYDVASKSDRLPTCSNIKIPIYLKPSLNFHLPSDPSLPVIMIAAGAGIAPFIGFLQHREKEKLDDSNKNFGEMWLVFGCRHSNKDFLYRNELEKLKSCNILSRLYVTHSRDLPTNNEKHLKYVQDVISNNGSEFVDKIQNGAVIYVCGDAKVMAKDVQNAIHCILQENLSLKTDEADEFIKQMQKNLRYIQDIWT